MSSFASQKTFVSQDRIEPSLPEINWESTVSSYSLSDLDALAVNSSDLYLQRANAVQWEFNLKSFVLLVAAAVLAPTIGVAMFFMVGSSDSGQPTVISATPSLKAEQTTDSGQTEISGRFVPQEPWRATAATAPQERKPETATARWSTEPGTWQTTVSCPGAPLPKEGPCPSLENGTAPKTKKHSVPDVTQAAESFASGDTDIAMQPPSRPLPGRMTVGGPKSYH